MAIRRIEDVKSWQLSRELTRQAYALANNTKFRKDFPLRDQICKAAGSVMHNIAEGFDSESNKEFVRFLRYAKRSCTEVQSELYVALDQSYIDKNEFTKTYAQASQTRAAIHGFIRYLQSSEKS